MSFFGNLDPEAYDRTYSDRQILRRMARYFGPHRRDLLVIVVGLTLTGALEVVFPLSISRGVNALAENPSQSFFIGLLALVLVTGVISWAVNYLRRRLTARIIGNVVYAMRRDAFNATMAHDLSFYDEYRSGRIVSRITSDTQEFAQVATLVVDTVSQMRWSSSWWGCSSASSGA